MAKSTVDMSAFEMTDEQIDAYVKEHLYCALATLSRDGTPINTPTGITLKDGFAYISTRAGSNLGKRMRRDPRVSATVFAKTWPSSFVTFQGIAELVDDSDGALRKELARPTAVFAGLTPEEVEEWLDAYVLVPRDVFRVTITKRISMSETSIPVDVFTKWVVTPPPADGDSA